MDKAEKLIREYLLQPKVMQLATSVDNKPWLCTLHFDADSELNIYWLSRPDRRHSEEIESNPNVAIYVLIHENTPDEDFVVGISIEGAAESLSEMDDKLGKAFMKKHNHASALLEDIKSGKNPHKFYKLVPTKFVLFDNKNFPDNPRQEWSISN